MGALPPNVRVVSQLAADHGGYSIANADAMSALSSAEDRHFWHRTRNAFIARRLARLGLRPPARVLELGCGGGSVAAHLARAGYEVTGVDGHLPRVLEAARRAPTARFLVHDLGAGVPSEVGEGFDAVGLFDVIEHLDDPLLALRTALALARPGGWVLGTVPAQRALWSEVDRQSGHRLRYERGTLEPLVRSVPGASRWELAPFNRVLYPLLRLQRAWIERDPGAVLRRSLAVPAAPVNLGCELLVRLEHLLQPALEKLPIPGTSLWFALQRAPEPTGASALRAR